MNEHLHLILQTPDDKKILLYSLKEAITIGRYNSAIIYNTPYVSGEHGRIFLLPTMEEYAAGLRYRDMNSRNGTYVARLKRRIQNETIALEKGDLLTIHNLSITIGDIIKPKEAAPVRKGLTVIENIIHDTSALTPEELANFRKSR